MVSLVQSSVCHLLIAPKFWKVFGRVLMRTPYKREKTEGQEHKKNEGVGRKGRIQVGGL